MIKKFTLSLFFITLIVLAYDANYNNAHTNQTGAPSGRTGSPGDNNNTCNTGGCHSGAAPSDHIATITSDVPVTGYIPGNTYTITATATKAGITKFGFELSPQAADGTKLGSFVTPLPAGTQFAFPNTGAANKYVTHTLTGTAGTDTKTWTVQWIAPALGTGTVTFYGAFNFTNSSSSSTGDVIKKTTLELMEDPTSAINETDGGKEGFTLFPNPATDRITLSFFMYEPGSITTELFDINGKLVKKTTSENMFPGRHELVLNVQGELPAGVYFIRLNDGKNMYSKKTVIQ